MAWDWKHWLRAAAGRGDETLTEDDLRKAREAMVRDQLESRSISDPLVLSAMRKVPRHEFVPPGQEAHAYEDRPLPIGDAQTISQPYMVASMTECLRLRGGEKVLELGTGSGYQAAVLADMGCDIRTVERHPGLSESAGRRLAAQGYGRVRLHVGDGSAGWPEEAPFDRILITAAVPEVARVLLDQLADGGRLVAPVGSRSYQELTVVERTGDRFEEKKSGGCTFVPLIGQYAWEAGEDE